MAPVATSVLQATDQVSSYRATNAGMSFAALASRHTNTNFADFHWTPQR
ncbi:MAG TPA: hypothetical protein VIG05_08300 [Candidatus Nitrosotenuis sp.]|jgi:hypothetical protein